MSSEDNESFSEPTLWVLIGSVVTALLAGTSWCVQKRCRRTHFAVSAPPTLKYYEGPYGRRFTQNDKKGIANQRKKTRTSF